jgi:hypothetical protein
LDGGVVTQHMVPSWHLLRESEHHRNSHTEQPVDRETCEMGTFRIEFKNITSKLKFPLPIYASRQILLKIIKSRNLRSTGHLDGMGTTEM